MTATMDLNLISTFVKVGELGSFTAAAHELGLPTSSVSRKVSALEAALKVRLIQRSTRKLILTEGGRAYFERARATLAGLAEATSAVADMSREVAGRIRFTAAPDRAGVLAAFIGEFLARYPKVSIEMLVTPRRVDLVSEGVDLALRAGRLGDSSLVVRRIGPADLGLYAAEAYLRRAGTPRTLADLARHRFVLYGPPDTRGTLHLTGPRGEETVKIDGPLAVDELSFGADAVAAGIGIGFVPSIAAERPTSRAIVAMRAPLVRVLPEYRATGSELNLVSPPTVYEPTRVSLLRDFLAERFGDLFRRCEGVVPKHRASGRGGRRAAPSADTNTRGSATSR